MKFNFKYSFFLLLLINLSFATLVLRGILFDKPQFLPAEKNSQFEENFDLQSSIIGIKKDSLLSQFPYSKYLKSNNYEQYKSIIKDIACLDSAYENKNLIRENLFYLVLSDSLYNRHFPSNRTVNLDSLNYTLQWAEKFKFYGESDPQIENKLLFKALYGYWLEKISQTLSEYSKSNEKAKFDFQFRYLAAKCIEKRYNVSVEVSPIEKVIQYSLNYKWAHLFEASWNQASLIQKIVIALFLIANLFCYVITFKYFKGSK